jgi:hypothetical protein
LSIITVIKEKDELIFSTDSRIMACDGRGVASDHTQKIFEVAPGTYMATSGREVASNFQIARARQLAVELDTSDIQVIGAVLERESIFCLNALVELLRVEPDEKSERDISGESLIHGCMLVGRTDGGKLGWVGHLYRVQAGIVKCETGAYFGTRRQMGYTSGRSTRPMADIISEFT